MGSPGVYHQQLFEHFTVDDLLDFPNDDNGVVGKGTHNGMDNVEFGSLVDHGGECSLVGMLDGCNSSSISCSDSSLNVSCIGIPFGNDLPVSYDDFADLEWLTALPEEPFSTDEMEKFHLISGKLEPEPEPELETPPDGATNSKEDENPPFNPEMVAVPGKARSKRSRAAPMDWASRLHLLSEISCPTSDTISSDPEFFSGTSRKAIKSSAARKQSEGGQGRKCTHCSTDKTPQWRTGPEGPKTLCNACGVRYKSGRLVPEYRPAASPSFVLSKHSNSHRKVMELRRQKELVVKGQHHQPTPFAHLHHQGVGLFFENVDSSNGDDFLIHQHMGPDFMQLI